MLTGRVEVAVEQRQQARDLVVDVAEAAGLRAVAVQRERLAGERLVHEIGDDPPVVELHARSVGVEDPGDPHLEPVHPGVRRRQRFGESLRFVVDRTLADRVDVAPVRLDLGMLERVAVDLAGGGEEEPGA